MTRYHFSTARSIIFMVLLIFLMLQLVRAVVENEWQSVLRHLRSPGVPAPLTFCGSHDVAPHKYSVYLHEGYPMEHHKQAVKHVVDLDSAFLQPPSKSYSGYRAELSDLALDAVRRDNGVHFVQCLGEMWVMPNGMPSAAQVEKCALEHQQGRHDDPLSGMMDNSTRIAGDYEAPLLDCDDPTRIPNQYHVSLHHGVSVEQHKIYVSHKTDLEPAIQGFTGPGRCSGPMYTAELSDSALDVVRHETGVDFVNCAAEPVCVIPEGCDGTFGEEPSAEKREELRLLSEQLLTSIRAEYTAIEIASWPHSTEIQALGEYVAPLRGCDPQIIISDGYWVFLDRGYSLAQHKITVRTTAGLHLTIGNLNNEDDRYGTYYSAKLSDEDLAAVRKDTRVRLVECDGRMHISEEVKTHKDL